MEHKSVSPAGEQLIEARVSLENKAPTLRNGYEAFQQSYNEYLKMSKQFSSEADVGLKAAAIICG